MGRISYGNGEYGIIAGYAKVHGFGRVLHTPDLDVDIILSVDLLTLTGYLVKFERNLAVVENAKGARLLSAYISNNNMNIFSRYCESKSEWDVKAVPEATTFVPTQSYMRKKKAKAH